MTMSKGSGGSTTNLYRFWQYHINQRSESGLNQNAYCRQNNLRPNRFAYWKNKFKKHDMPVEFVQVLPGQNSGSGYPGSKSLLLHIADGLRLEIPENFSQAALSQVLQVLKGL